MKDVVMINVDEWKVVLPKEIPELTIEPESMDEEMQNHIDNFLEPIQLEFSCYFPVPPGEMLLVLCGVCTLEQIQQNNWRKFHGIPMKRRRRCNQ